MDRRYLAFFASSFAIILLWQMMFPPEIPVKPNEDQAAQAEDAQAKEDNQPAPNDNDAEAQNVADDSDDGAADETEDPGEADNEPNAEGQAREEIEAPQVNSPHYVTLGSLDPEDKYRFATTFNSHGATIKRLQLASPKYRELDNRSGFLGHLELIQSQGGVEVQTVATGSPAAEAGLRVGDIISTVGEADIAEAGELSVLLAESKPGDSISLTVLRDGEQVSLTAQLTRQPLSLIRPEAENILLHRDDLPENFEEHPSLELAIRKVGPQPVMPEVLDKANQQLAEDVWAVDTSQADQLTFSMVLPDLGLEVVKRFVIEPVSENQDKNTDHPAYHLDLDIEIRNLLATPQQVSYTLQGPSGLPIEGFWYANKVGRSWSSYGIRDIVLRTFGRGEVDFSCRAIAEGDVDPFGDGESLAYIGVDAQYFAAALIPQKDSPETRWYATFEPNLASTKLETKSSYQERYQNASFLLTSKTVDLAAKGEDTATAKHNSKLFLGPKHPELLAEYQAPADPSCALDDFVYYGWFGSIGIPQLMVSILSAFYAIVRNYGLAIILLTVVVRSCMYPLSRKQAKNMLMMQELKPEMDRINARYKDDPQARVKAQQELWAKHNYNPMGGCLLMFIQLPIFIGLYRALMVDVDLRQAALIPGIRWCSNLAAPDMLLDWSGLIPWQWFVNGEGILALGPYLNILPLATVGLFLLQQKMFMPPPADEQAEMMQKVMKYMMLFMSFMFFKVASGLCLYFIASSLWGIAERKMIPRPEPPKLTESAATTDAKDAAQRRMAKKRSSGGKGGNAKSGKGGKRKR